MVVLVLVVISNPFPITDNDFDGDIPLAFAASSAQLSRQDVCCNDGDGVVSVKAHHWCSPFFPRLDNGSLLKRRKWEVRTRRAK